MPWFSHGYDAVAQAARGSINSIAPYYTVPPAVSTVPADAILNCGPDVGCAYTPAGEVWVFADNGDATLSVDGGVTWVSRWGNQFGVTTPIPTATKLTYLNAANVVLAQGGGLGGMWLKSDNTLWAIAVNQYGSWGDADPGPTYHGTPVQIASGVTTFAMSSGGSADTVTLYVDTLGDVYMAGRNDYGQRGNGTTGGEIDTFAKITALSSVSRVWSSGENCFALSGTTLYAWGRNTSGGLGVGSVAVTSTPTTVSGLPAGVAISDVFASSGRFTYVLLSDGRLYVTGRNLAGELGLGTNANHSSFTQATVGASLAVTALPSGGAGLPTSGAVVAAGLYWATGPNVWGQVKYSDLLYSNNSFENLNIYSGAVSAIAFVNDSATFVNIKPAGRSWAFVYGL